MIVALTGASGFLGRELVRQLEKAGHEVRLLLRTSSKWQGEQKVFRLDFSNSSALSEALNGVNVLLHAAGVTNGSDQVLRDTNIEMTRQLTKALPDSVKRVVYISSAAATMRKGLYGESKLKAEEIIKTSAKESGREWVMLRPTLIVGPGDSKNLASMVNWVKRSPLVPVLGGGKFKVQPVFIEDAAKAMVNAVTTSAVNAVYHITGPEQVSLREMLEEIKRRTGSSCFFVSVPLGPVQVAVKAWAMIWPWTKLPVKQISELDKHEAFDWQEGREALQFNPRSFQDSLDWLS